MKKYDSFLSTNSPPAKAKNLSASQSHGLFSFSAGIAFSRPGRAVFDGTARKDEPMLAVSSAAGIDRPSTVLRLQEAVTIIGAVRFKIMLSCGSDRHPSGPETRGLRPGGARSRGQCSPRDRAWSCPFGEEPPRAWLRLDRACRSAASKPINNLSGEILPLVMACAFAPYRQLSPFCRGQTRSVYVDERTDRTAPGSDKVCQIRNSRSARLPSRWSRQRTGVEVHASPFARHALTQFSSRCRAT